MRQGEERPHATIIWTLAGVDKGEGMSEKHTNGCKEEDEGGDKEKTGRAEWQGGMMCHEETPCPSASIYHKNKAFSVLSSLFFP